MAVLENAEAVGLAKPDFQAILQHALGGCLVITAAGDGVDFVSRSFAPGIGIDEDRVTGSAHCLLTPFWRAALGKDELTAKQLSARGGELSCRLDGKQVRLVGQCATYLVGNIVLH
jgi:predicted PhzF superfamily epimerase YddE/YHI9